jgi:hypothetical protein
MGGKDMSRQSQSDSPEVIAQNFRAYLVSPMKKSTFESVGRSAEGPIPSDTSNRFGSAKNRFGFITPAYCRPRLAVQERAAVCW